MRFFLQALRRELVLHSRNPADVLNPLVFFIVVITLFPLGLGPSQEQLSEVAPAVIWIAALLAALMSMDLMFRADFENGSLQQFAISDRPVMMFVLAKVVGHWLVSGLPLLLLMPVVGLVMFVEFDVVKIMSLAMLLVSPTLSLLGSIGAALTVGLARGGLLVSILILPLYVPVLILATGLVQTSLLGGEIVGYVYWLVSILLLAVGLAPLATVAGIKIAVER